MISDPVSYGEAFYRQRWFAEWIKIWETCNIVSWLSGDISTSENVCCYGNEATKPHSDAIKYMQTYSKYFWLLLFKFAATLLLI